MLWCRLPTPANQLSPHVKFTTTGPSSPPATPKTEPTYNLLFVSYDLQISYLLSKFVLLRHATISL